MHLFEPAMKRDRYPYLFIGREICVRLYFSFISVKFNIRQNEKDLFTLIY